MKSLQEFINEQKNFTKGLKKGDQIYVVISSEWGTSDMKPFEVTIVDKTANKSANGYYEWYDISENDYDITSILINTNDDEVAHLHTFATGKGLAEVFVGRSVEDLETLLNSKYGDQIKDITKQIEVAQKKVNELNDKLNSIIKKSTLNK